MAMQDYNTQQYDQEKGDLSMEFFIQSINPYRSRMINTKKQLTPIYMLAHPVRLLHKLTYRDRIQKDEHNIYFKADLDALQGNLRSPVFDMWKGEVVEILCKWRKNFDTVEGVKKTLRALASQASDKEIQEKRYEKCQKAAALQFIKEMIQQLYLRAIRFNQRDAAYSNLELTPQSRGTIRLPNGTTMAQEQLFLKTIKLNQISVYLMQKLTFLNPAHSCLINLTRIK